MTQVTAQLFTAALSLPEGERATLAANLIDSLDPDFETGVEAAWSQEIQERIREVQSGDVTAVPWEEARKQILEDGDHA